MTDENKSQAPVFGVDRILDQQGGEFERLKREEEEKKRRQQEDARNRKVIVTEVPPRPNPTTDDC